MSRTSRRRPTLIVAAIMTAAIVGPVSAAAAQPAPTSEQTVAIGGPITVSGTGCLIDGVPAELAFGLYRPDEPDRVAYFTAFVTADADGTWTVTATIPTTWPINFARSRVYVRAGTYQTRFTCIDLPDATHPVVMKDVPGDTEVVHITDPAAVPPPTEPQQVDPPEPAPRRAPAPVRAAPRFTG